MRISLSLYIYIHTCIHIKYSVYVLIRIYIYIYIYTHTHNAHASIPNVTTYIDTLTLKYPSAGGLNARLLVSGPLPRRLLVKTKQLAPDGLFGSQSKQRPVQADVDPPSFIGAAATASPISPTGPVHQVTPGRP